MLEAIEYQSYKIHCEQLASLGIDTLKSFPELDEYTVEAADGHFIDHARNRRNRGQSLILLRITGMRLGKSSFTYIIFSIY